MRQFTPSGWTFPRKYDGFNWSHDKSITWNASPENVEQLKKHLAQFLTLSTGGPAFYDDEDIKSAHSHVHIANPEFDAAVGDLTASLDHLQIASKEQKELLSIIESVRPQIVEER
jgi:truncated hemoglobin YjbI